MRERERERKRDRQTDRQTEIKSQRYIKDSNLNTLFYKGSVKVCLTTSPR